MHHPALVLALAAGSAALVSGPQPATAPTAKMDPPPGMVLIDGGRTKIGSERDDLEEMFEDHPTLRDFYGPYIAETPQHTVTVDDFFLMVTEVTNEQFEAYVRSSGSRPPRHWAEAQMNEARLEFLQEQGKRKRAAIEAGETPQEDQKFDPKQWWDTTWQDVDWALEDDLRPLPVTHIDYQDAKNYARWAGLRLLSEAEYQRACRGSGDDPYPWGDRWQHGKYAATNELDRIKDVFPVGSFPDGASEDGVFDLAGNVWEWTTTRYVAYPGFEYEPMEVGKGGNKEMLDNPPNFNADFRVMVGGSIQNSRFVARCTTRAGFDRNQITNSLGFRCAGTPTPGLDMSRTLLDEIPRRIRPVALDDDIGTYQYVPEETVAMDRWLTRPGKATAEGYALIDDYEYVIFTPVEFVDANTASEVRDKSLTEMLQPMGFLATNQTLVEPDLAPGTYLVAFRGEGKRRLKPSLRDQEAAEQEEEAEESAEPAEPELLQDLIGLDPQRDNFVFFDMTGQPVASMPTDVVDWGNPTKSTLDTVEREITIPAEEKGEEPTVIRQKWLEVRLFIPGDNSRKGFRAHLPLRFEDGVLTGAWRM